MVGTPELTREQAAEGLGRAFKRALTAVRRLRGRDTHRAGEIPHAQYALLFELAVHGELAAGELAGVAELAPATVTAMLDHLTEAGLVVRARSERDRRIVVSRLTDAGREQVAARHARVTPVWNAALADFDADQLRTATAVLERLREFLETLDDGTTTPRAATTPETGTATTPETGTATTPETGTATTPETATSPGTATPPDTATTR